MYELLLQEETAKQQGKSKMRSDVRVMWPVLISCLGKEYINISYFKC